MSKHKNQAKKKVSIIIPFYGQTESELSIPLSSINNQIGIDFATLDVHLVNDGGAPIDITKFDIFSNLDLHYHELPENVGPGLARQYGIDNSEGDYVMFVDSDDELTIDGLIPFYQTIEQTGAHSIICSNYIVQEKMRNTRNKFSYDLRTVDSSGYRDSLCGKWFSRIYLRKINLRFHPELKTFCEDSYFGYLAFTFTSDISKTGTTSYMARFNANSISHSDSNRQIQPLHIFAKAIHLEMLKIRELKPEILMQTVASNVVTIYLLHKKIQATDEAKFWEELHRFVAEFSYDASGNFQQLKAIADAIVNLPSGYYYGVDTSDLREFLGKI